jgi:hypothetical protein
LKFFIATILLIAFAAQTFTKELLVLDYYTNTTAFEKDCVNKDKPMMHCCGRCQLRKKLLQQENSDKQNPEQRDNKNEVVLSSKSFFATVPLIKEQACDITYPELSCGKEIKMPHSIFHPPGA